MIPHIPSMDTLLFYDLGFLPSPFFPDLICFASAVTFHSLSPHISITTPTPPHANPHDPSQSSGRCWETDSRQTGALHLTLHLNADENLGKRRKNKWRSCVKSESRACTAGSFQRLQHEKTLQKSAEYKIKISSSLAPLEIQPLWTRLSMQGSSCGDHEADFHMLQRRGRWACFSNNLHPQITSPTVKDPIIYSSLTFPILWIHIHKLAEVVEYPKNVLK